MSDFTRTRTVLREVYAEQRRVCRLRLRDLRGLRRVATDDAVVSALDCAIETERRLLRTCGELEGTIQRIGGEASGQDQYHRRTSKLTPQIGASTWQITNRNTLVIAFRLWPAEQRRRLVIHVDILQTMILEQALGWIAVCEHSGCDEQTRDLALSMVKHNLSLLAKTLELQP